MPPNPGEPLVALAATGYTDPSVLRDSGARHFVKTVTLYCVRITDRITGSTSASIEIAYDFSADWQRVKYGGSVVREVELLWLWEVPAERAEATRRAILDADDEALPPCAHMFPDGTASRH